MASKGNGEQHFNVTKVVVVCRAAYCVSINPVNRNFNCFLTNNVQARIINMNMKIKTCDGRLF